MRDIPSFLLTDRILAISRKVFDKKTHLLRRLFLRHSKILPIGTELENFLQIPSVPVRRGLKVLVISRIHPEKGLDVLMDALEVLGADNQGIEVAVCGGVSPGREAFAREIQERVRRLQYAKIEFLGWREDIRPLMSESDAVVLTSKAEGMPRSILEAMAAGRPTLSTDVGGVGEMIMPGETGLLVGMDDSKAVARGLSWLRDHPEERTQMCMKAREFARQHFSIQRHMQSLAEHVRDVTKNALQNP